MREFVNRRRPAEELRAEVLDVCRRLIAAGLIPSDVRVRELIPGYSETTVRAHRRALREEGLIDWSHLGARDYSPGLPCETEEQRKVIRERARIIREERVDPDTRLPLPPRELSSVTHTSTPVRGDVR